jgi:hypothetical protein
MKSEIETLLKSCDESYVEFLNKALMETQSKQWVYLYTKKNYSNIYARINPTHFVNAKKDGQVDYILESCFISPYSSMCNPTYKHNLSVLLEDSDIREIIKNKDYCFHSKLINMFEGERQKRGIQPGDIITASWHPPGIAVNIPLMKKPGKNCKYDYENDTYTYRGKVIYKDGQWANVFKASKSTLSS